MLRRVNRLIEDIRRDGHQGIGRPEQLRGNWAGFWSRRIDQEHRLAYRIVDDTVQIVQCRYHYEQNSTFSPSEPVVHFGGRAGGGGAEGRPPEP
jgi:toxin YoeB